MQAPGLLFSSLFWDKHLQCSIDHMIDMIHAPWLQLPSWTEPVVLLISQMTHTVHYKLFRINFEQNIRISIHNTLHYTNISKEKNSIWTISPKNKYNNTTFPFTKILSVISSFNKSVIPQAVLRMTFISILNQCIISMFCLQESRASLYVCLFFMFAYSLWMLSITV